MEFTQELNVQIAKEVVSRTSHDGTIIVMKMTDDDFFYKINGVAAEIWQKLTVKSAKLGDVISEIASEYKLPEEKIMKDAQNFLNKILDLKLIELV